MKYKIGQIYYWRNTTNIFGKAISYYNFKEFPEHRKEWLPTHVGIIVGIEDNRILIAEASSKGYLVDDNWYDKKWIEDRILDGQCKIGEVNEPMINVYQNAKQYEGIGYGWLDIIMIGMSVITGFRIGLTGKNKIICSEADNYLIYDSTKTINIAAEWGISPDQVTPAYIYLSKQQHLVSE